MRKLWTKAHINFFFLFTLQVWTWKFIEIDFFVGNKLAQFMTLQAFVHPHVLTSGKLDDELIDWQSHLQHSFESLGISISLENFTIAEKQHKSGIVKLDRLVVRYHLHRPLGGCKNLQFTYIKLSLKKSDWNANLLAEKKRGTAKNKIESIRVRDQQKNVETTEQGFKAALLWYIYDNSR